MPYETTIHFSGLVLFVMNETPPLVILPWVRGEDGSLIGKHVPYIAFEAKVPKPVIWKPEEFPLGGGKYEWVRLDGEDLTLSMSDASPFDGLHPFLPQLQKKYCKGLAGLKEAYKTGDQAAARLKLNASDVGWHVSAKKRIETIITLKSNDALTLTATKCGECPKKLVFPGDARLVIGNSDEHDLYSNTASWRSRPATGVHRNDFLFYYQMFELNPGCKKRPTIKTMGKNPKPKDPVIELPGKRALDIACSNSQYP